MSRAKLVAYKVKPEELLDLIDGFSEANAAAILTRCPGGRLIRSGYMCGHCGLDPGVVYDAKGEEAYQRKAGEKYHRKCGAPAKRVVATTDLMGMVPILIEE